MNDEACSCLVRNAPQRRVRNALARALQQQKEHDPNRPNSSPPLPPPSCAPCYQHLGLAGCVCARDTTFTLHARTHACMHVCTQARITLLRPSYSLAYSVCWTLLAARRCQAHSLLLHPAKPLAKSAQLEFGPWPEPPQRARQARRAHPATRVRGVGVPRSPCSPCQCRRGSCRPPWLELTASLGTIGHA